MNAAIDTVVFDIGNVLLDWDPNYLYVKIFPDPAERRWFLANVCTPAWNREQDRGRPWPDAEAELVTRFPQFEAAIRAFRARWIEMIPRTIAGMPELYADVGRAGLRRLAITNFAADTFEEAARPFPFLGTFEGAAVSGRLGLLKPDPAIYRWLIETYAVDPQRAVFVDDVAANVAAAAELGFKAVRFVDEPGFRADLARLGVTLA